jgi:oxygen-independent coproporphyrinogen III oxidase
MSALAELGPLYQDYAYGYPHKTAYRTLSPPISLKEAWAGERGARGFLYVHIPFCGMRCGFCNLFTTANPGENGVDAFLGALAREADAAADTVDDVTFVQMAIGGGTPTFLPPRALDDLIGALSARFGVDPHTVPAAIETSPDTLTRAHLDVLSARGFERISIGVQSFIEDETRAMGRPQKPALVNTALSLIRDYRFSRLNIDLIYGAANQTRASWRESLMQALAWAPEEIYLYPLYVRRRTGLDGRVSVEDAHRLDLYRVGRDILCAHGYTQVSMRAFRRQGIDDSAPEFVCQEDCVLGLGAGARSYTRDLHYASDFAVSRAGVNAVLAAYTAQSADDFGFARHGIAVNAEERQRRFVLKSILRQDGLDMARFRALYGDGVATRAPLQKLTALGLLAAHGGRLRPTETGLEHSDAIAPLFYSADVRARMQAADVK